MDWPFWSLRRPAHPTDCEDIEPLLSLSADGMASKSEIRRVEAHLPGCPDCTETLFWIQATHRTLAARPVALPPAGLQSRIAQAIAASSAAPISLRPARSFRLRPAYAATASVSALGLALGYSLLHTPSPVAVNPLPKQAAVLSAPAVKLPSHIGHSYSAVIGHTHRLTATNPPPVIKVVPTHKKPAPINETVPNNRVADNAPPPAVHMFQPPVKAPVHVPPVHDKVAVNNATHEITHNQTHLPVVINKPFQPKTPDAVQVAKRLPEPPSVLVHILPPVFTKQSDGQTASASGPQNGTKYADGLDLIRAHAVQMQHAAYVIPQTTYQKAANAMQSFDADHVAYVDAIHSK